MEDREGEVVNTIKFEDEEFKTSSLTGKGRYACVTVAIRDDVVGVRHTRDGSKTTLEFNRDEWKAFIGGVKNGEFDCE